MYVYCSKKGCSFLVVVAGDAVAPAVGLAVVVTVESTVVITVALYNATTNK